MNIYKKLFKYVPDKKHLVYIAIFMSVISSALSILPYWYLYKFLNEFLLKKALPYVPFSKCYTMFDKPLVLIPEKCL